MRLGVYLIQFPVPSETFIVSLLSGLAAHGIELRLFTDRPSTSWDAYPHLSPEWYQRITPAPPFRPWWRVPPAAAHRMLRTPPRHLLPYLRHHLNPPRPKKFYSRLHFAGAQLDLLYAPFDMQAPHIADLKQVLGCKLVTSCRGDHGWQAGESARRSVYTAADGYHFKAAALERHALAHGLPPTVTRHVNRGWVDASFFTPTPRPADTTTHLISVGRLTAPKGYAENLAVIAALRQQGHDIHYHIVGDGPDRPHFEAQVAQLNLTPHVTFWGRCDQAAVRDHLNRADLMLHLSHIEGISIATLEAQAMGLPVIATDVGGQAEGIHHDQTGYIVPPHDVEQATAHTAHLITNPTHRHQMGRAARQHILSDYHPHTQLQRFIAFLQEVHAA